MVFHGYELGTKRYKCFDLETSKVYICRDVIFEEKSRWNWRNFNVENKMTDQFFAVIANTLSCVKIVSQLIEIMI